MRFAGVKPGVKGGSGFALTAPWTPSGLHIALLITGLVALLWYMIRPVYYKWILSPPEIDVVVFCDTTSFREVKPDVFLLYDRAALSPVAKALGLLQNRSSEKVNVFFPLKVGNVKVSSYSVYIKGVPKGPLSRIVVVDADGISHSVDVSDRTIRNNKMYVRAQ